VREAVPGWSTRREDVCLAIVTVCCHVRVQGGAQAPVDCPAVRFFDWNIILWMAWRNGLSLKAVEQDPGLLHARCPYSGRTLLSVIRYFSAPITGILLDLGADPTMRDWQVRLPRVGFRRRPAADVTWWQGRGLLYWAVKSGKHYVWQDLLVRGVKQEPISYCRRPSTSGRPALTESLGFVATIAGLEYFDQQISTKGVKEVRTLPC
jgi:hypothetical protein